MPLSSTPIWARRVNVFSLATAHATAWHSRSTSSCVAPSKARSAARPRATSSSTWAVSSGVIGRGAIRSPGRRCADRSRGCRRFHYSEFVAHRSGITSVGSVQRRVKIGRRAVHLTPRRRGATTFLITDSRSDMWNRSARGRRPDRPHGGGDETHGCRPRRAVPGRSWGRARLRHLRPHQHLAARRARAPRAPRFITTRHEQVAAHAADGYARASGGPASCCCTSGPGMTNAATGVATAAFDSIPLLVIAGDVPSYYEGRGPHQEFNLRRDADQVSVYEPFVKRAWRVARADQVPRDPRPRLGPRPGRPTGSGAGLGPDGHPRRAPSRRRSSRPRRSSRRRSRRRRPRRSPTSCDGPAAADPRRRRHAPRSRGGPPPRRARRGARRPHADGHRRPAARPPAAAGHDRLLGLADREPPGARGGRDPRRRHALPGDRQQQLGARRDVQHPADAPHPHRHRSRTSRAATTRPPSRRRPMPRSACARSPTRTGRRRPSEATTGRGSARNARRSWRRAAENAASDEFPLLARADPRRRAARDPGRHPGDRRRLEQERRRPAVPGRHARTRSSPPAGSRRWASGRPPSSASRPPAPGGRPSPSSATAPSARTRASSRPPSRWASRRSGW